MHKHPIANTHRERYQGFIYSGDGEYIRSTHQNDDFAGAVTHLEASIRGSIRPSLRSMGGINLVLFDWEEYRFVEGNAGTDLWRQAIHEKWDLGTL